MKRVTAGLAVVVVLAGGFYTLIYSLVSSDNARVEMVNALTKWSGSQVSLGERVDLRLLPAPRVTLYDLKISEPGYGQPSDILSADVINAEIRVLPLLIGRVGFKTLEVVNPKILITRTPKGRQAWRIDGSSAAVQLALTGDLPVERLALKNGIIEILDVARAEQSVIGLPEFSLEWENLRDPAIIRGSIARNNGAFSFDIHIADPLSFFERKSTAFTMALDGELIEARLEGNLTDYKAVQFSGNLAASGPSLRSLISLAGGVTPQGPGLGPFSVSGTAQINPKGLFVDEGEVELDGNIAAGSIQLNLVKGAKLAGTLAFQSLDMTPYLVLLGGSGSQHWSNRTVNTSWFRNLDADLRLSADRIIAGSYELGSTAASAFLSERQLEIGVAESAFYGGTISGTISVTDLPKKTGQKVAVQLRVSEFDLSPAVKLTGTSQDASGKATITVDLETEGPNLGEQFSNSAGSFSVRSTSGEIPDLGVAHAWQALSESAELAGVVQGSASAYERLEIDGTINDRIIMLDKVSLDSGTYAASLHGAFRMADNTVALDGRLTGTGHPESGASLSIDGPISDPWLAMDPSQNPVAQPQGN